MNIVLQNGKSIDIENIYEVGSVLSINFGNNVSIDYVYPLITEDNFSEIKVYDNGVLTDVYKDYSVIRNLSLRLADLTQSVFLELKKTTDEDTIKEIKSAVTELKEIVSPTADIDTMTLEKLKAYKRKQFNTLCENTIYDGMDIELSDEIKHFSFTDKDQINIKTIFDSSYASGLAMPYHADGEECKMYENADIAKLYFEMQGYITYNTTYTNLIGIMLRNCLSTDEAKAITYGQSLSDDLQAVFDNIITQSKQAIMSLMTARGVAYEEAQTE